ncbi:MAG: M1 family aminopeptidase [Calditrichia bacterium]
MKYAFFIILFVITISGCTVAISEMSPVEITRHQMSVEILQDQHQASVSDTLSFQAPEPVDELSLLLNDQAEINAVEFGGEPIDFSLNTDFDSRDFRSGTHAETDTGNFKGAAELKIFLPGQVKEGQLVLHYTLVPIDSVDKAAFSREYIAYEVKGYIGDKGIFISPAYYWYATLPASQPRFSVKISSPDTLFVMTQGKLMTEQSENGKQINRWKVDYPTDGIHLVGAHYGIQKLRSNEVDLYTFFFPNSQELADSYLKASERYLKMYESLIGPYPFSKFAVVENFFPTGYGMPSYTLLGSQVIRLPFIIYTSLGHEMAHNWWGNSVYVDYESGNWCEGLTTYYADYHYQEMKSPQDAMRYRRDIDRDFTVYVKEGKDFPLKEFEARTESSSRAIGYGKSAMVFHQLRRIIGDSLFYNSLKSFYRENRFRKASWHDIQQAVEQTTGKNYDWFFKQWIQRPGAPEILLENVSYTGNQVKFTLKQSNNPFRLYVPVQIIGNNLDTTTYVWLENSKTEFTLPANSKPEKLLVDPAFDLFRKLDRSEIPPTLSEMFAQDTAIIVLPDRAPDKKTAAYRQFAQNLAEGNSAVSIQKSGEISADALKNHSLYLLGSPAENSLWKKIRYGQPEIAAVENESVNLNRQSLPGADDLVVLAFRSLENPDISIVSVTLGENVQIGRVGNLLSHYGKYSYLTFEKGKNRDKGVYPVSESPLIYNF